MDKRKISEKETLHRQMKQKDTASLGRVRFVREEVSLDKFCRGIFGFGLDQLIEEVLVNKDGKYDALYKKDGKEAIP